MNASTVKWRASPALIAAAFLLSASAARLDAQLCGAYFFGGCDFGYHKVLGPGPGVQNLHGYCAMCVYGDCHPGCTPSEEEEDSDNDNLAYEAIIDAAAAGYVGKLMGLAQGHTEYLSVNWPRKSMQVMACDRVTLVANLPIPSNILILAAALLGVDAEGSQAAVAVGSYEH